MSELLIPNPEADEEGVLPKTSGASPQPQRPAVDKQEPEFKMEEEGEEMVSSAALEPSTLQWPGDRWKKEGMENETMAPEKGETNQGKEGDGGGDERAHSSMKGQESRTESERELGWRESRAEEDEIWRDEKGQGAAGDKGDGSLADDEEEDEEEIDNEESQVNWMPEKAAQVFTPKITIVHPSSKQETIYTEGHIENTPLFEAQNHMTQPEHYQLWPEEVERPKSGLAVCCSESLRLGLAVGAAAVIFPLLVWGGYALLPFDAPPLISAPLRLVYTLRCAFFATLPIVLGVLVQGASRLKYGALKPLYEGKWERREVSVHSHYVRDSLSLYLLYFLQMATMATYMQQDMLKLVPLLTIIFVFGRLIYWVCVTFGSSVRGLGYGLSFLPILAMLAANLYFVCSSNGQGAIFDVAPPTTASPPRQRWWG